MKLWIFNWIGGGYNSVQAIDRNTAIAQIRDTLSGGALVVDLATLHVGTFEELNQLDSAYGSLCA